MIITTGTVRAIPLVDIETDEATQIRAKTYPETVREYRAAMLAYDAADASELVLGFPPIKVHERKGKPGTRPVFIVVDGWHRVTAARAAGKRFVEAEQVYMETPGDLDEMRWLATKANLTPGLKLTNAEKREALRHYLKAHQHRHPGPGGGRTKGDFKTLREIGRDLAGMHHETDRRYLARHAPRTLAAILAADPSASEDEAAEPIKGEFSVDGVRGKRATKAIEEVNRLVRLIDHPEVLKAVRKEIDGVTKVLVKKGA
ncbi:hypothetical protein COL154_013945 [Colletotrichum chrysophilum]|nr:hypothetical protein COL154_013945 [Colletotrichum chrysophilum]